MTELSKTRQRSTPASAYGAVENADYTTRDEFGQLMEAWPRTAVIVGSGTPAAMP